MSAVVAGGDYPGNEGWLDLSSGFMVIVPREGLSERIAALVPDVAAKKQVFGDQDLIQAYFADWRQDMGLHLAGGYNVYFDHYQFYLERGPVKAVHFIGRRKPWTMNAYHIARECVKCLVKGNREGIPVLRRYLRLVRDARGDANTWEAGRT